MFDEFTQVNADGTAVSEHGSLRLIIGPMFSGKTSRLIQILRHNRIAGIPTCILNHSEDTRYHSAKLSTHDKTMVDCLRTTALRDVCLRQDVLEQYTCFLVNEGQFFEDLLETVSELVCKHGKTVCVAGLDSDFEMQKFGQILDLIPICEDVEKLHAICSLCKGRASFTKRLSQETCQKVIGSTNYMPTCRGCHKAARPTGANYTSKTI